MNTERANEKGFSLIELLIAMGITVTMMAVAAMMMSGSFNIRGRENARTEALAAAQRAVSIISRDIANAGFGLRSNGIINQDSDSTSIRIRANLNAFQGVASSSTLADPDEDVEYFLHKTSTDPNSSAGTLMRYDVNTQTSTILVSQVDDFEIYYFNQKVDYTLDPTGGIIVTTPGVTELDDQSQATYVVITTMINVPAVGTQGSPGYQPAGQIQLASDVLLRNRNLIMY
jgi:type II secretory pathway pseudopilin PulG